MSSTYKKIFAVIIAVLTLFIKINSGKGIIYTQGTSTGEYGSCGGNYNGCLDPLGFEFTIIKVTDHGEIGLQYETVEGTQKYRLYKYFGLGNKLKYSSPNTAQTLDIIAKGGDVFSAIMTGTKATKLGKAFYDKSNNYAILVEELFGAIYWTNEHPKGEYTFDKKDCVFYTGKNNYQCNATVNLATEGSDSFRSSDIAKRIASRLGTPPFGAFHLYGGYDKYNGYRNVVAALSCNLYIDTNSGARDLCSDVDYWDYSTEGKGRKERISAWLLQASTFNKFLKIYNAGLVYGFEINPPKTGNTGTLRLNKRNSNNELIIGKSATFRLYKSSNCSGNYTSITVGNSGYIEKTLDPGTYSIKEYKAPSGYGKSDECKRFTITARKKTTVDFINTQNCALEFNALSNKSYPSTRIWLYNKYGFKNLLNFTITNATEACKTDNNACGKETSDCLSYSKNDGSFNYNNLSCFSRIEIDASGRQTFCIDNFKLTNKLGVKNFGTVKSGQMVINKKGNNKIAATGVIDRICYTYGDAYGGKFLEASWGKFAINDSKDNYDVYFNYDKLSHTSNRSTGSLPSGYQVGTYNNLTYIKYTSRLTNEYSLNPVYSKSGTGEATNNTSDKFIGYGLISKFSDKGTV